MPHDHVTLGEKTQIELERKISECSRLIERYGKEDTEMAAEGKERERTELCTLVAPSFFGQESVLDPTKCMSLGTVVTDTVVHALAVHKVMIQAFDVTPDFLEKVKRRSTSYPDDIALKGSMDNNNSWEKFKTEQMSTIKKTKWSVKEHGAVVVELPGGKSYVKESMKNKKGDKLTRGAAL